MAKIGRTKEFIREMIQSIFDEERIPNPEADEYVNDKSNFVGSHTYGENIGKLDKMYVAYSYGEQHPLYVWVELEEFKNLRPHDSYLVKNKTPNKKHKDIKKKKGIWFYNEQPYYVSDKKGHLKPNKWTKKHLEDLKPNDKIQARDTQYLKKLISDFKKKYNIRSNVHTNLKPGEK